MYPESLLWWLGGTAVLLGILSLLGMLAWAIDRWHVRHTDRWRRRHGADDQDGSARLRAVFELLSAVLVVTSLLVAVYSDSQLLRAAAGIALIVVVSAATITLMSPRTDRSPPQ